MAALGRSNRQLIQERGIGFLVRCVVERLRLLASVPTDRLERLSAEELVKGGFCDVVRLFVKNEPHSEEKLLKRRLRLISSVSIVDQLVERVLFTKQDQKEISMWTKIPSKPGIGLDEDEQLEAVWHSVQPHLETGNAAESDVSGWDWSVQGWELMLEAEMRVALAGSPSDQIFHRLIRNRFVCMKRSVLYLSDGRMLAQRYDGIMKSGAKVTGSSNSRIRTWCAFHVGASWAISMGDDCVEGVVKDAEIKYAALGHPLKSYKVCKDGFEFCSHYFKAPTLAYPTNWGKSLFRLLNRSYEESEVWQYEHFIRHHPEARERSWWLLQRVGWGPLNNTEE